MNWFETVFVLDFETPELDLEAFLGSTGVAFLALNARTVIVPGFSTPVRPDWLDMEDSSRS